MAIFVANLAYDSELAVTTAKAAVLLASTVAGVVGFLLLLTEARRSASAGVAFVALPADGENVTHDGAEARRGAARCAIRSTRHLSLKSTAAKMMAAPTR